MKYFKNTQKNKQTDQKYAQKQQRPAGQSSLKATSTMYVRKIILITMYLCEQMYAISNQDVDNDTKTDHLACELAAELNFVLSVL